MPACRTLAPAPRRPGWAISAFALTLLLAGTAETPGQAPRPGQPNAPGVAAPGQPGQPGGQLPLLVQQPGKVIPADQQNIDRAIQFGVEYLRRAQLATGGWIDKDAGQGSWGVGYASLAGLALIECGVPSSDAGIVRAANFVRRKVLDLDNTYEASLAILFLDRMNGSEDKRMIQMLAYRLIAGQAGTGGWGYKLPKLSLDEQNRVSGAFKKLNAGSRSVGESTPASFRDRPSALGLCIKASDDYFVKATPATTTPTTPTAPKAIDPEKLIAQATTGLSEKLKKFPVLGDPNKQPVRDPVEKRQELLNPTTDNSNTHFAMLALWAARKHDVPTDRTFSLLIKRFRTSQTVTTGQWDYNFTRGGGGGSPAMTCVAMLGMAIGHALEPEPGVKPEQDPKTLSAFKAVSASAGEPVGHTENRPTPKSAGGLYYLWALERIGVLYDVALIGKKDWYLWGAEILLCHQNQDGSWTDGGQHVEHPVLSTSLALLFLKRANLTAGLNKRLRLDSSTLTAKVSGDVTPPKKEEPKADPPPIVTAAPIDVPPAPVVTPRVTPPTPAPEPAPATTTAVTPKESSNLPWILLGVLLLVGGGLGFFAWRTAKKRREEEEAAEEEEERRAKKKHKKKKKAVVQVDDDE